MIMAVLAAPIAVIAAVVSRSPSSLRRPRILAITSVLASLFPLTFSAYLYHIDYVAVGGDGTAASGPLWRALLFPFLPVLASIFALAVCHFRSRSAFSPPQA